MQIQRAFRCFGSPTTLNPPCTDYRIPALKRLSPRSECDTADSLSLPLSLPASQPVCQLPAAKKPPLQTWGTLCALFGWPLPLGVRAQGCL